MEKITKRQKQLLEIIYNYIKDTGYPPTFKEMRESLDVVSNQSIIDLLVKLEKQKLLKKNDAPIFGFNGFGKRKGNYYKTESH